MTQEIAMTQEIEEWIANCAKLAAENRAWLLSRREKIRAVLVERGYASDLIDTLLYYHFDLDPKVARLSEKITAVGRIEYWAANKRRSAGASR